MSWHLSLVGRGPGLFQYGDAVSKIRENIYRSNIQVTFELYSHFRCLQVLDSKIKTTFTKCCLTQWISKLPRSFEIHWIRQNLVNFTGLMGIVNITIYKIVNFHRSWASQIVLIFNTEDGLILWQFPYKGKTFLLPSYPYNGNPYTCTWKLILQFNWPHPVFRGDHYVLNIAKSLWIVIQPHYRTLPRK